MKRPISKTYGVWNPIPQPLVKQIIDYYLQGNSAVKTGEKFGVNNTCIGDLLKKNGLKTRGRNYKTGNKKTEIIAYYLSGRTVMETALFFKLGKTTISQIIKENNIVLRNDPKGRSKKTGGKEKQIIDFYLECKSGIKTAAKFDICPRGIYKILKRHNIKTGSKGVAGPNHHNWKDGASAGNVYMLNRMKVDPLFKLKINLRNLIGVTLRSHGYKKQSKTYFLLGADYSFVKNYLESKFQEGMTWENYGCKEMQWSLDHKQPLASAKSEQDLLTLFHYTNLEPMWHIENMKKGSLHNGKRYSYKNRDKN